MSATVRTHSRSQKSLRTSGSSGGCREKRTVESAENRCSQQASRVGLRGVPLERRGANPRTNASVCRTVHGGRHLRHIGLFVVHRNPIFNDRHLCAVRGRGPRSGLRARLMHTRGRSACAAESKIPCMDRSAQTASITRARDRDSCRRRASV
jgi:hypothetical protein